jgi:hypothetical protein
MNKSETIGALSLALSKAQGKIKGALRDSNNPFFKSKYADLESVWDACREQLSSNELAVVQLSDETDKGIIVETILTHSSGEWISGRMFIPITSKLDAQTVGSATTYARRYCLQMMVGIAPVDDDGNAAAGKDPDPRKQAAREHVQETAKPPAPAAPIDLKDAAQHDRIKTALKAIYGDDKNAALAKVEELTTFIPKGKTEAEIVPGKRNFLLLKGTQAKIVADSLEKLVANASAESQEYGGDQGENEANYPEDIPF